LLNFENKNMRKIITLIFAMVTISTLAQVQDKLAFDKTTVGKLCHDTLFLENNYLGRIIFSLWLETAPKEMEKYLPKDQTKPRIIFLCKDGFIQNNEKADNGERH